MTRFLVTGHTGFKGAWLTLLLLARGHEVSGISLDPEPGALFGRAAVGARMRRDVRLDIRDAAGVRAAMRDADPEVLLHLAAQPLVRESYRDPRTTVETNVMGTYNVLAALDALPSLAACVIVTTDKVYRNVGKIAGYLETDELGAGDPYSSSKAMADILTQSWVQSFPTPPLAIARAGNVIGGGDVSADRLLVDLLDGFADGRDVPIRLPEAVRPWQHVLDCLNGYLALADALLDGRGQGAWNFGPDPSGFQSVRQIADTARRQWGSDASWTDASGGDHPHEALLLTLDPGRARRELGWHDLLAFPESLEWTVEWRRRVDEGEAADAVTQDQIDRFLGREPDVRWMSRF